MYINTQLKITSTELSGAGFMTYNDDVSLCVCMSVRMYVYVSCSCLCVTKFLYKKYVHMCNVMLIANLQSLPQTVNHEEQISRPSEKAVPPKRLKIGCLKLSFREDKGQKISLHSFFRLIHKPSLRFSTRFVYMHRVDEVTCNPQFHSNLGICSFPERCDTLPAAAGSESEANLWRTRNSKGSPTPINIECC